MQNVKLPVMVVSYRNSTSNHNGVLELRSAVLLYLIEILHQTTTEGLVWLLRYVLYLIEILHQTTTEMVAYISFILLYLIEILHQTTTIFYKLAQRLLLYLIEILHQTTTRIQIKPNQRSCILSKFYIKPQLGPTCFGASCVVSYRNSTSNHNKALRPSDNTELYLIEILHQTTTYGRQRVPQKCCILSKFYIKPQPVVDVPEVNESCILSKFYIKPQPQEESC